MMMIVVGAVIVAAGALALPRTKDGRPAPAAAARDTAVTVRAMDGAVTARVGAATGPDSADAAKSAAAAPGVLQHPSDVGPGSSPDAAEGDARDGGPAATSPAAVTNADFRVPIEPMAPSERVAKPAAVHGIYLNAWAAGSSRKRAKLIALADRTEINTFVIDVKDATGYISYESRVPLAKAIGSSERRIADVRGMLAELKEHGIYPIARIVAFKDPVLAKERPDWAIRDTTGAVWHDRYDDVWVDAFNRHVWDYDIAIAREALSLGFAEVQWDYVRFPDTAARLMRSVVWPAANGRSKSDAISEFMAYSRRELSDLQAPVTADVFGLTTSAGTDMGIGQFWPKMVGATDVLLPMVYPSHYMKGSYGIAYPNGSPYEIVKTALEHAIRRSAGVDSAAAVRPWLQDFTLGEPHYGPEWVRAQIQAVYDVGLSEWVLWNAGSDYTMAALTSEGARAPRYPIPHWSPAAPPAPVPEHGPDVLGAPVHADTAGTGPGGH